MTDFPSMKARDLLAVLMREPLNYEIVRQRGSHRRLQRRAGRRSPSPSTTCDGRPGLVRKILCRDVGLSEDDALKLL